jgi:hypothetical protein
VVQAAVRRTEKVSAAFIKELMRRAAQFRLDASCSRTGAGAEDGEASDGLTAADLDNALDEILFRGGSLNRNLLGSASLGFAASSPLPEPEQEPESVPGHDPRQEI